MGACVRGKTLGSVHAMSFFLGTGWDTSEEKLRLQQLQELRRRWLGDQSSALESQCCPCGRCDLWRSSGVSFYRTSPPWKSRLYKVCRRRDFVLTQILTPAGIVHYLTYHVSAEPYAIVERNPRIFPGDIILETEEVVPPKKEYPDQHH
nr:NADH dehydrogenase [ubiquinone] 1 beta subcomplex subunit 6-like [Dasypus novemcinctus]